MLRPGLVSISFRALSPRDLISACAKSQLEAIEWGADVHAPPDNLENARQVGQMTRDAGLEVAAYGSYWRCDETPFEPILEAALAMCAPLIRVWAGKVDARESTRAGWTQTSQRLAAATALAREANVQVATEFHGGTLTSSGASARRLMQSSEQTQLSTLWQPLRCGPDFEAQIEENVAELHCVAPCLSNVHVYEWADDAEGKRQRLPLSQSAGWPRYVEELRQIGGSRWLLLEFVPNDDPAILAREAAALRGFIGG